MNLYISRYPRPIRVEFPPAGELTLASISREMTEASHNADCNRYKIRAGSAQAVGYSPARSNEILHDCGASRRTSSGPAAREPEIAAFPTSLQFGQPSSEVFRALTRIMAPRPLNGDKDSN